MRPVIDSIEAMRKEIHLAKALGLKIGLVPTMGYLHEGHLSLIDIARAHAGRIVVSIYVNPTQFGPQEDLSRYPRDLAGDVKKCFDRGAHIIFVPTNELMYPIGYETYVSVEKISKGLCGAARPTHFRGVTTIVAKLFNIVKPDVAVFGQKDYQQLKVIERMVKDLDLDLEIIGGETVREADGLALSSRNSYLKPDQRQAAVCLYQGIQLARRLVKAGICEAAQIIGAVRELIGREKSAQIEYVEICDTETLEPLREIKDKAQILMAVQIGATRLIDNGRLSRGV